MKGFASKDMLETEREMAENIWLGSLNHLNPYPACLNFRPVLYFA